MKRFLPAILAVLFCQVIVDAQVVLNSSMAPQPGSMLHFQALDDPAAFVFDKQGENLTWDLRGFASHTTDTVIYVDPATTAYPNAYPSANLAVTMTDGIGYIDNNTSQELLLGVVGDPGNGVQPMPFYPPMSLFDFPYTYGSSMNTSSQVRVKMDGASFGIPGTDSVKYHMTLITNRVVQGWGTLMLPGGTYEGALLEKSKTTQVDSAWMKVIILGWILAPGYPTTTYDSSYRWLTGEMLHPYVEVNYDENGIQDGVTFYNGLNVNAGEKEPSPEVSLLPNPATDKITFRTSGFNGIKTIEIVTPEGQRVSQHNVPGGSAVSTVTIGDLKSGVYMAVVTLNNGKTVVKRVIKR